MNWLMQEIRNTPWAMEKGALLALLESVRSLQETGTVIPETAAAVFNEKAVSRSIVNVGPVAIIPIQGIIRQKLSLFTWLFGGASTELISAQVKAAAADPEIKAIILDIESPGGSVSGVTEATADIREAREQKPVVAVANTRAASAAYCMASAASEIVVSPSGDVGSIGTIAAHLDLSKMYEAMGLKVTLVTSGKYKGEFDDSKPLSEEAREELQRTTDAYYKMFLADVAKGRGVSIKTVRKDFGQGRMKIAKDALKLKMVDRIATFEETLKRLMGPGLSRVGKPKAIETTREFEAALREALGFTHKKAAGIAKRGFQPRDEGNPNELQPRDEGSAKQHGNSQPRDEGETLNWEAILPQARKTLGMDSVKGEK